MVLSFVSVFDIINNLKQQKINNIREEICERLIQIESLNIPYFQLKNSIINIIQQKIISHVYHSIDLYLEYIEVIYRAENVIKNNNEYTIGRGKTGTLKGTGVKGWLYIISIQYSVSFQKTCHHNNAQKYQIGSINKKDKTIQFIKLSNFSFLIFISIKSTKKKPNIAHTREKL